MYAVRSTEPNEILILFLTHFCWRVNKAWFLWYSHTKRKANAKVTWLYWVIIPSLLAAQSERESGVRPHRFSIGSWTHLSERHRFGFRYRLVWLDHYWPIYSVRYYFQWEQHVHQSEKIHSENLWKYNSTSCHQAPSEICVRGNKSGHCWGKIMIFCKYTTVFYQITV